MLLIFVTPIFQGGYKDKLRSIEHLMRFILLDKVTDLVVGERITAVKALSLSEEYLSDHFPNFPVLPGVFMVEAMVQTAAMLVRVTNNFQQSMIVLKEARNIKYKSFVKPGNILKMSLEAKSISETESKFIAHAHIEDQPMVEARLSLNHFNLADRDASFSQADEKLIKEMKSRAQLVGAL